MILLALADADYKFIWVSMAEYGSASDCQVFNESELRKLVEGGELGFPDPEPLPGLTENLPYFFLGDDAFALRTWMMKPYSRMGLGHGDRIFNYRLSRARRWWKMRSEYWPTDFNVCFMQQFYKKTESVKSLVLACVMLHNLLSIRYPGVPAIADEEDQNPSTRGMARGESTSGYEDMLAATLTTILESNKETTSGITSCRNWFGSMAKTDDKID